MLYAMRMLKLQAKLLPHPIARSTKSELFPPTSRGPLRVLLQKLLQELLIKTSQQPGVNIHTGIRARQKLLKETLKSGLKVKLHQQKFIGNVRYFNVPVVLIRVERVRSSSTTSDRLLFYFTSIYFSVEPEQAAAAPQCWRVYCCREACSQHRHQWPK